MRLIDADRLLEERRLHLYYHLPNGDTAIPIIDIKHAPTVDNDEWIPVSERLPEEKETIFAKLKGTDKWRSAMFEKMSDDVRVVVVFSDGTRKVSHSHTVDGKWGCEMSPVKRTVTHWMPNPELPKDGDME